jgi:ribonuclease E
MARRMLIDATHPEETRVVVLNGTRLEEFDFETSTKKQIKGNIYLAKITRVEPSLQAAFVEYGGNRHGFLAFSEIHPDYYRIPVSDREAMLAEERASHDDDDHGENGENGRPPPDNQPDFDQPLGYGPDDGRNGEDGPEPPEENPAESDEGSYRDPRDLAPPGDEGSGAAEVFASAESEPGGPASVEGEGLTSEEADAPPAESATTSVVEIHDEPTPLETVGGDELEEVQARPRIRHYRNYKIQEVIKRRQILLIQVNKEERGNKGAALTTYLSLAGRYCVLMPNAGRGGGVSRKITSLADRRRLKELMEELEVPDGMGIIVRTAGSERSKAEIKRDYEYLLRLWDDIRELTLRSSAPALIYEEGNLIKRAIRDLYSRDMEEILVEGEDGYRTAKEFMRMLMPSHSPRVKSYRDPAIPLLHRFQVDSQIDQIHNPVVQLRSGGYIVINPTEALVSIDVNSGRATKERNIEETATKTNLEAAEEIARQLRLRDLAGLVVIDFIDMEETRNQKAVEARLKDAMKTDRARIQLGRISAFGLLELSRQRLRSSLIEASTQPCPHCNGTGTIRSTESTALVVLRALEEEGIRRRSAEVTISVPTQIALYVLNQKRTALGQIEQRYGFTVTVAQDDSLIPPAFRLDRMRALTPAELGALPAQTLPPPHEEEEEEEYIEEVSTQPDVSYPEAAGPGDAAESRAEGEAARRKRRRRKRRRGGSEDQASTAHSGAESESFAEPGEGADTESDGHAPREGGLAGPDEPPSEGEDQPDEGGDEAEEQGEAVSADAAAERKRRRRGKRGGRRRRREDEVPAAPAPAPAEFAPYVEEYPSVLDYARDGREHLFDDTAVAVPDAGDAAPVEAETPPPAEIPAALDGVAADEAAPKPKRRRAPRKPAVEAPAATEPGADPAAIAEAAPAEPVPPKRRRTRRAAAEALVETPVVLPADEPNAAEAAPEPIPAAEPPPVAETTAEPVEPLSPFEPPVPAEPAPIAAELDPEPVLADPTTEPEALVAVAAGSPAESEAPGFDPDRPRKTGWWKRLMP